MQERSRGCRWARPCVCGRPSLLPYRGSDQRAPFLFWVRFGNLRNDQRCGRSSGRWSDRKHLPSLLLGSWMHFRSSFSSSKIRRRSRPRLWLSFTVTLDAGRTHFCLLSAAECSFCHRSVRSLLRGLHSALPRVVSHLLLDPPCRPLKGFDLIKDRETGSNKGYGFCVWQVGPASLA